MLQSAHRALWLAKTAGFHLPYNGLATAAPRLAQAVQRLVGDSGRNRTCTGESAAGYFRAAATDYEVIARHAGIEGPMYRDRAVLELGPGNALGVPLVARLRGARACEAYDAFDILSRDRAYLDAIYQPIARSEGGSSALVDSCIMHTSHASLVRAGRRFDRVVSRAVLEHVKDLEGLFDALGHVVTRDAVAIHEVDLRSHGIEHDHPLDFLTVSGPLWRAMTSHTDAPNRVRAPAYLALGERAGLTLVWAGISHRIAEDLVVRIQPRLAREFRSLPAPTLAILGLWLVYVGPDHPLAHRRVTSFDTQAPLAELGPYARGRR